MKMHQTRGFRIAAAVLVVVVGILIAVPIVSVLRERHRCEQRLVHLLCETDYQALLRGCREFSRRVAAGDLKQTGYVLRPSLPLPWFRRFHRDPETASLPREILDLDPMLVTMEERGRVWVALFPAPRQGVVAYPENYENSTGYWGNVELAPGLWFWDDQYSAEMHPEFVKYIAKLVERGRELQRNKLAQP